MALCRVLSLPVRINFEGGSDRETTYLTYIYKARRMNSYFTRSKHWRNYDPFSRQKISTFRSSRPAVLELATKYQELVAQLQQHGAVSSKCSEESLEAERLLFTEMCEICLWGNATDLSLLTSLTYEDIQKLQGSEARKSSEKNILVNDLPAAFHVLKKAQESSGKEAIRRVDIILDNAGFELFVDLILAGYLLSTGLATQVVLHPKSIPWFVSDVLPADFGALLNALADPQRFYSTPSDEDQEAGRPITPLSENEVSDLSYLFQNLSTFHQEGQLLLRPNLFWTSAASYWNLHNMAPGLYDELRESELVIFKGDLNYRKLTRDVRNVPSISPQTRKTKKNPNILMTPFMESIQAMWDPTTPFATALGPLGARSGIRTLALRTCKADVVVGLPQGRDEELMAMTRDEGGERDGDGDGDGDGHGNGNGDGNGDGRVRRKWAWGGKWAVVQFCDGKVLD